MPETEKNKLREHLLILLAFTGITVLMTWPVVAKLSTYLAGGRDDLWVHQWTFWWIRQALREGLNPFFTPYLYFPEGVSLTSHNIAWFNIALWLPLQALVGRITAYNLVFLIVIALNGFCMYLFAYTVTKSRLGAFVAGLVFGFWPYTLSHYDHANMMVVFWVPLALFLLHHLILNSSSDQNRLHWWLIAATALSIAIIGITRWQLLIMSGPILIAYVIYLLAITSGAYNRKTLLQLLIAGGLALLLMAPLAAPLVIDQVIRDFPDDAFLDESQWGRTDLLAFFIPSIHNGIWRERVASLYENFVVNQFYTPYLGFVTLIIAIIGLIRRWNKTWLWLLLTLLYLVLALGPILAINGREYAQIPMPYRLVEDWFLLRLLRRPDRLNLFLSLPLAMLAAWGMEALLTAIHSPRLQKLMSFTIGLLILLTYSPIPFATTKPEVPAWYAQAGTDGEEYAVLDLPINDRSYDKWYMQYQTTHGKPLATGHVSRLPREAFGFLDSVPLLKNLRQRDQLPDPALTAVSEQLRLLHEADIRYLVIHKAFANEGLQTVWRDWLTFAPAYEDEDLIVYRTRPLFGQDFTFASKLTSELGLIAAQHSPMDAVQSGTIAVDARWGTAEMPTDAYDVCLLLLTPSGESAQIHCFPPDPVTPTGEWPANDVRHGNYVFQISENVDPGRYELALSLAKAGSKELVGETVTIGSVFVHAFSPSHTVDASWQDEIQLTGYDLEPDEETLKLTLFWQAQQPVSASYKVFVHLINRTTGEILAQSDAIPRDWRYPTNAWEPGEIIRDVITLPLSGIPSAGYELRVGLYDEQTGQRLLVVNDGSSTPQEYLTMMTVEP